MVFKIFCCVINFYPFISRAETTQLNRAEFHFSKRGNLICEVSGGRVSVNCYETAEGLNGEIFSDSVEHLYPQLTSFVAWHTFSPDSLPKDEAGLKALGGAILVEPQTAEVVESQLKELDIRDLAIYLPRSVHKVDEIRFALQIEWVDAENKKGHLNVQGTLALVDHIFEVDLGKIFEFRDRFVPAIKIQKLSGDSIPLSLGEKADSTLDALNRVIAPMIAGKFVSLARIGFNQIETKIQRTLRDVLNNQARSKKGI